MPDIRLELPCGNNRLRQKSLIIFQAFFPLKTEGKLGLRMANFPQLARSLQKGGMIKTLLICSLALMSLGSLVGCSCDEHHTDSSMSASTTMSTDSKDMHHR